MDVKLVVKNVNDVLGSVWLATAALSYARYNELSEHDVFSPEDFAFSQTTIQYFAQEICAGKVHKPRISQWANADHPNHNKNYLRAVGKKRRLTCVGECKGISEYPEGILDPETEIFTILREIGITYRELVSWVKEKYSSLFPHVPLESEQYLQQPRNEYVKSRIRKSIVIPEHALLKNQNVDLVDLIMKTSFWVKNEIFDYITQNNNMNAPGVFYPYAIRRQKCGTPHWEETKDGRLYLDLNHRAQDALAYSIVGKTFQASFGKEYTCCHIYGGEWVKEWRSFTNVANMVLVPKSLQSLTDHHSAVLDSLKQVAYLKYGWKPEKINVEPTSENKERLTIVNELEFTVSEFTPVYEKVLDSYRKKYKTAFKENSKF